MSETIVQSATPSGSHRLLNWSAWSRRRRRRCAARLRGSESGSAAVEFAIVAPFFFLLLFVIAETALVFIAEQVMDNAVFETARTIRTGQVQLASMSQEDFKEDVCGRMSVFVTCDSTDFFLDVKSYASFAALAEAIDDPPVDEEEAFQSEGSYEFGAPGEIVVVRAYYQWPTNQVMGLLSLQNMANGKRLIGSFAAFRNEPYVATAQAQ